MLHQACKASFWRLAVVGLLATGGAVAAWYVMDHHEERALSFSLPDLQGRMHTLDEWRGHLVLMNFWAPWCEPCRREIPLLNAYAARWSKQGVIVVGLGADTQEHIRQAVEQFDISYPVLLGEGAVFDVARAYGNREGLLPFTVLVDQKGFIVWRHLGEVNASMLDGQLRRYQRGTGRPDS